MCLVVIIRHLRTKQAEEEDHKFNDSMDYPVRLWGRRIKVPTEDKRLNK